MATRIFDANYMTDEQIAEHPAPRRERLQGGEPEIQRRTSSLRTIHSQVIKAGLVSEENVVRLREVIKALFGDEEPANAEISRDYNILESEPIIPEIVSKAAKVLRDQQLVKELIEALIIKLEIDGTIKARIGETKSPTIVG